MASAAPFDRVRIRGNAARMALSTQVRRARVNGFVRKAKMRHDDTEWYRRLADVPGVNYQGRPGIDARGLFGHGVSPEVQAFEFDGEIHRTLNWPGLDSTTFSTSQSPAAQWRQQATDRKLPEMVRLLYESLELPGQVADYHFGLLGTYDVLWKHRSEEAWIPPAIEDLCLIDIELVEAQTDAMRVNPEQSESGYYRIPAFQYLVRLYELEGYIKDALKVARRAAKFGQSESDIEHLTERLANLGGPDAG